MSQPTAAKRRRFRGARAALLAVLVATGVATFASPASADTTLCSGVSYSTCTNAGYTDHGYGANSGTSYWGMYAGHNCTNYAAYVLQTVNGQAPVYGLSNAYDWDTNAASKGFAVNGTPAVGAIAQWNGSGHVAYVESVNSNGSITVSEDNWGGSFNWRVISAGSANWPHNFIHFKDVSTSGVGTRLLGDVNGDGKDDAVVMFKDSGTAMVALSTGGSFTTPTAWSAGHSLNASKYFLSDVDGDGKADLVAFYTSSGNWFVSLSSGSGFWTATQWAAGQGTGTSEQFLADVNGDGKDDEVTFYNGNWYVDTSSGSGFWGPPSLWISGHGVGSSDRKVADFNGDGKADAGVYFASNGNWHVGLSSGGGFGYPGQWSAGHGAGSIKRLAGDVSGDGKADAAYFHSNGNWFVGTSSGSGFWTPTQWAADQGTGTSEQFLADVSGDGKADEVTYYNGNWYVDTSSGSGFWGPPSLWISGHGVGS